MKNFKKIFWLFLFASLTQSIQVYAQVVAQRADYELHKDVVVLTDKAIELISDYTQEVVTLSQVPEQLQETAVGKIISCKVNISKVAPYGFVARISAVNQTTKGVSYTLKAVELNEVFIYLNFESLHEVKLNTDSQEKADVDFDETFELPGFEIEDSLKRGKISVNNNVNIEGTMGLTGEFCGFLETVFDPSECLVPQEIHFSSDMNVSFVSELSIEGKLVYQDVFERETRKVALPMVIVIGGIPTFYPKAFATLNVEDAYFNANLTTSVTASGRFISNFDYVQGDGYIYNGDFQPSFSVDTPDCEGGITASFGSNIKVVLHLQYYLFGWDSAPTAGIGLGIKANPEIQVVPNLQLDIKVCPYAEVSLLGGEFGLSRDISPTSLCRKYSKPFSGCLLDTNCANGRWDFGEEGVDCGGFCAPCCPSDRTFTNTLNQGQKHLAANTITASNTVDGSVVDYQAGNSVSMMPGFSTGNNTAFHASTGGCLSSNKVEQHTEEIRLHNYPNPFTEQTTIEFVLPEDSPVTLYISDAMGRTVEVLLDNEDKQSGVNGISFNGSRYPAGMYYYSIQAGEYSGTQKMLIIK